MQIWVILTEFKNNESGVIIKEYLNAMGYQFIQVSSIKPNKNGVGIFSRNKIDKIDNPFRDKENMAAFICDGYRYYGVFCANDNITKRFIEDLMTNGLDEKTIIIGDFNTGPRGSKPDRYDDLNKLVSKGYIDLYKATNSEICWSYQSGIGKSQPDHVFGSPDFKGKNIKVDFDLSPIVENISDHGIMLFELCQ